MGKASRFVTTQDAFDAWNDYSDSSIHLRAIKAAMQEQFGHLSRGCFCHACGVWIAKGILVTQALVYYGPFQGKLGLVQIHAGPCIPRISITFEFPTDDDIVLSNERPLNNWLCEHVDDFNVRTLDEAKTAFKTIGPVLDTYCADRWKNAVITVDGEEREVFMR